MRFTSASSARCEASARRHDAGFLAKSHGLALVLDRGGQRGPGVGRLAAFIEPFSLFGQDDAEVALDLDSGRSSGDELFKVLERLGEVWSCVRQAFAVDQQLPEVVLRDGQVVPILDGPRLAGQELLGDGDRAFQGVLGARALDRAQVEENLGLPALAFGRPELGVGWNRARPSPLR